MADRRILVGTASWTDPTLIKCGRFYPPDVTSPEDRLKFYASKFDFVEVDSTYYTLEMHEQAAAWSARTPGDFTFDIKAFRLFTTHQTPPKMLPRDVREELEPKRGEKRNWYYADVPPDAREELWQYFERSLAPLRDAGKLGAILLQFPPWFLPGDDSRRHLQECADRLDGYRVAVEFRNKYWMSDRNKSSTLAFMRENGLAHVIVDEPQGFKSSVPQVWRVTDPALAVVRMHGHNKETWEKKGLKSAAERFNYLYNDDELDELATPVRRLTDEAESVHVTFNNNYEDYAQRNAEQFIAKLEEASA